MTRNSMNIIDRVAAKECDAIYRKIKTVLNKDGGFLGMDVKQEVDYYINTVTPKLHHFMYELSVMPEANRIVIEVCEPFIVWANSVGIALQEFIYFGGEQVYILRGEQTYKEFIDETLSMAQKMYKELVDEMNPLLDQLIV